jgi:mono/diheme cytochrome c family protein
VTRRATLALVLGAAALGGCSTAAKQGATVDAQPGLPTRPVDVRVVNGGVLYVQDGCQACHSVDGTNKGARTFQDLANHRSDATLLHSVADHVALHPSSAAIIALRHRPRDVRALVDFIEQLARGG